MDGVKEELVYRIIMHLRLQNFLNNFIHFWPNGHFSATIRSFAGINTYTGCSKILPGPVIITLIVRKLHRIGQYFPTTLYINQSTAAAAARQRKETVN